MTLEQQLKDYYAGKLKSSDSLYFGITPDALSAAELDDLPLAFGTADFKKSVKDKHNVPRRAIKNVQENLENALFAFSDGARIGVVVPDIDADGKPLLIGIEKGVQMDAEKVNAIRSMYGLDHPAEWIRNQIESGKTAIILDEEKANAFLYPYGYLASRKEGIRSMDGSISSLKQNVKPRYSLKKVPPVKPTNADWSPGASFDQVKEAHPTLFELAADEADTRNPTQITGTVKSYRKIYDKLRAEGFDGTILDASSGLGYGTRAGRTEYGFSVDDIEPFPDAKYHPDYTDYSTLDKTYDVIISNAVLNVIPQDLRDAMVVKIGEMLNPGGRAFINVRGSDVKNAGSKVAIHADRMEYFISNTGSYQKGFTSKELVGYLRDALGDGFTVEPTKEFGAVSAVVTRKRGSEVVTRYSLKRGIGEAELRAVQSIGRKSVNDFDSADIKATEQYARQYWKEMGEKSPFFRGWFGDWRANDRTPVQIASSRGDARGPQINEDTGWKINISGKVFNETKSHASTRNMNAHAYLPYINDIVKKAVLLDSYAMGGEKTKSANSLLMHSMYAVADIGNGPELLKLYVEEMNDPNSRDTAKRAYQLQNIEHQQSDAKGSGFRPSPVIQTADIQTIADLFAAVKRVDKNFNPKGASKVVNEDGTPKVVYHQTAEDFTIFEPRHQGAGTRDSDTPFGIFMKSSDKNIGLNGEKQMALYAKIVNPLTVFDRADLIYQLKMISPEYVKAADELRELNDAYQKKHDDAAKAFRDYIREWRKAHPDASRTALYDDAGFTEVYNAEDNILDEWESEARKVEMRSKEAITRDLESHGYDGVIIQFDKGSWGRSTDAYIALHPEQVKSATDNIGTFDRENPDIRYSLKRDAALEKDFASIREQLEAGRITEEQADRLRGEAVDRLLARQAEEYGRMQPGETPAREITLPRRTDGKTKVSRTVRTILEGKATPELALPGIKQLVAEGAFS